MFGGPGATRGALDDGLAVRRERSPCNGDTDRPKATRPEVAEEHIGVPAAIVALAGPAVVGEYPCFGYLARARCRWPAGKSQNRALKISASFWVARTTGFGSLAPICRLSAAPSPARDGAKGPVRCGTGAKRTRRRRDEVARSPSVPRLDFERPILRETVRSPMAGRGGDARGDEPAPDARTPAHCWTGVR